MKIFIVNPGMVNDYIYELSSSLSKKNFSVYLFGSDSYEEREVNFSNFNYYNKFFNVEKIKSSSLKTILKAFLYVFLQFYVLCSILREKPDVIHLQWCRIPLIDSLFIRIYRKYSPVVFTLHNTTINHGDKTAFTRMQTIGYKSFLKKVSSLIVHTEYSKNKFLNEFPEFSAKVEIVPHGLLAYPTKKGNKTLNFSLNSKVVLLFFGNIQRYKGLDILIEAMHHLKNQEIMLLVAGKANIPIDDLQRRAEELNISDQIYWHTHFIPDEDVEEVYDYCDIVVLPHRHIDQSGVLMSAINFSKPVVASDTGGFSEIIENGKHGFLFKPEDSLDLAYKISRMTKGTALEEMNINISSLKNSWKTWEEISEITLEIYKLSINLHHAEDS